LLAAKGYREGILRMNRGMTVNYSAAVWRRARVSYTFILTNSVSNLDPSSQLLGWQPVEAALTHSTFYAHQTNLLTRSKIFWIQVVSYSDDIFVFEAKPAITFLRKQMFVQLCAWCWNLDNN